MLSIGILGLIVVVAAANGANDVSKAVATLVGSGTAPYRTALAWGALTTFAGAVVSAFFADRLLRLFTAGIVSTPPTALFTLAVLVGTAGWLIPATLARLPVSTTHALIGSLLGAGLIHAPDSVLWSTIGIRLAAPLALSVLASWVISALLTRLAPSGWARQHCICVTVRELDAGAGRFQQIAAVAGTTAECRSMPPLFALNLSALHWVSSGAVGFARALNDTPKLVAVGAIAAGDTPNLVILAVSVAMFAGSLIGGYRVTRVLSEGIVRMDHREGFLANVVTAILVGVGANMGLPMSTTHVAAGAITGIAGTDAKRLALKTVRGLAVAWLITPLMAGTIAASVAWIAS